MNQIAAHLRDSKNNSLILREYPTMHGQEVLSSLSSYLKKKKIVLQEKGNLGTFYAGDCYIVLKVKKVKDNLVTDLHLWIGDEVVEEEAKDAVAQVCQADSVMDDATLYRQMQNFETREFIDLFENGIKYLSGAASKHVQFQQGEYVKRLFQIKGKRNVRVFQVPLDTSSLNEGDSFLLDDEWTIFCWNGKDSSKVERAKAIDVARMIRDDFCFGKAVIIIADQGVDKKEERMFFQALGGRGTIQPKIDDEDDETDLPPGDVRIYRVTDENGAMEITEINLEYVHKDDLKTEDCFIVDGGKCGIYVWSGTKCTTDEKHQAFKHAIGFIESYNYPACTSITCIMEGKETRHFKSYFKKWPEKRFFTENGHVKMIEKEHGNLFDQHIKSVLQDMIDEGMGPVKIWRVEGFYKVCWPHELYGTFYETDTYLVQYESSTIYKHYVIYIWEGSASSKDHKLNAHRLAQQLDVAFKANTTQIQVVHGKEPDHFLCLFKGKLKVLMGSVDNEYTTERRDTSEEDDGEGDSKFFMITGNTLLTTKAVQLPLQASLLQSEHVFLLQTEGKSFIWDGCMTSETEQDCALVAADRISPDGDLILFKEGYETHEFWTLLNGRAEYNKQQKKITNTKAARLFLCSTATGTFKVDEVSPYDQMDLNADDVMLMDAVEEIYLWIGNGANSFEKKKGWETVMNFIKWSGRDTDDVCIIQVKQGLETKGFASLFPSWDDEKASETLNYLAMKKEIKDENMSKSKEKTSKKRTSTWAEQRILKRLTTTPR